MTQPLYQEFSHLYRDEKFRREGERDKGEEGSEPVNSDTVLPLPLQPLVVGIYPPGVGLVRPGKVALPIHLVPRLGREDVVDILDAVVAPDGLVDALPAQRLERVVDVRQGHPAAAVQVREHRLVREVHVDGVRLHVVDDLLEDPSVRVHHLQAAVHEAQRPHGRVDPLRLRALGVGVLVREGARGGHPVGRVVRLAQRVADAGVPRREDARALAGDHVGWVVELKRHELVHVAPHQHVRVELDDSGVLVEREGRQLRPAVVEARVVAVVLPLRRQQVLNALGRNAARGQGGQARGGKTVGVEGDQGVLGFVLLQREVEGQETREVGIVGDQSRPDYMTQARRTS